MVKLKIDSICPLFTDTVVLQRVPVIGESVMYKYMKYVVIDVIHYDEGLSKIVVKESQ